MKETELSMARFDNVGGMLLWDNTLSLEDHIFGEEEEREQPSDFKASLTFGMRHCIRKPVDHFYHEMLHEYCFLFSGDPCWLFRKPSLQLFTIAEWH